MDHSNHPLVIPHQIDTDEANIHDPPKHVVQQLQDPNFRFVPPFILFTYKPVYDPNIPNTVLLEICCLRMDAFDLMMHYGVDGIRNLVIIWLIETMNFLKKAGMQPFGNHNPNQQTRPIIRTTMQEFMEKIEWNTHNQHMIKFDPNNPHHTPHEILWMLRLNTNLDLVQYSTHGYALRRDNLVNQLFNRLSQNP